MLRISNIPGRRTPRDLAYDVGLKCAAGIIPALEGLGLCLLGILTGAMLTVFSHEARAGGALSLDYADANFTFPLVIDNPYWPLNPDSTERTFTYVAETEDGCVVEETFVDGDGPYKTLTGAAPYTGGLAVQAEDIGYIDENCDGTLVKTEHTFDWYRQDDNGNIWYVGELSLDYEIEGCEDTSVVPSAADKAARPQCYVGSWEAGTGSEFLADAGIVVPSDDPTGSGDPLTSGTYYMQEFAEDAMDAAKVIAVDTKVKYKIDGETVVFRHCRVTKEYSSLERGAVEHKSYCPDDDGLVVVDELSGGKSVLVVLEDVSPGL